MTTGGDVTVGGDFIVNEQSQLGKPLNQCTNEELIQEEEPHNRKKVRGELVRKAQLIAMLVASAVFAVALYCYQEGVPERFEALISVAGLLVAFASAKILQTPTDVEETARMNLRIIDTILRMRDARR